MKHSNRGRRFAASHPSTALLVLCCVATGCSGATNSPSSTDKETTADETVTHSTGGDAGSDESSDVELADVVGVSVTGDAGAYTFSVTVRSPDAGCDRYADYWEVLGEDGALVYRRILAHSHVDEQPFSRSGGPVAVAADQEIIVRAHMNPGGYGGQAYRGSVEEGFAATELEPGFAPGVGDMPPQPTDCAF